MERRDFLKLGGSAALVASFFPQLLKAQPSNSAAGGSIMMKHFKVTESELKQVIAKALERGGDYADLFFENTLTNHLTLMDGAVNRAVSDIDFGVGVRVLSGDRTGYAYTENIVLKEMLLAANTASRIAQSVARVPNIKINKADFQNHYPVVKSWEEQSIKEKAPYLQQLNDRIFAMDQRVTKVNLSLSDSSSYILFFNSEGQLSFDYRPMVSLGASCIMEQGGRVENGRTARSYRTGFEFLTMDEVEVLAKETVDQTARMFEAIIPKGGEMPVVMAAGGSGILLHEAIGHAFEADFNRKGMSIFSDKLGKKICNESINVVDDGTIQRNRGSISFDDEGIQSQKTYIVKDGVLASYLHDRISAKFYGVSPTGNGRRESFRYAPIPRMRVTYMENGKSTEDDLISSVKQGVYVDNFANGEVQIGAGDFTFFVKSGYLIENGKLTQPIKDINIIGNGPRALADVEMVANNLKIDNSTWTCGKYGQGVPVSLGLPSVLIKKLTVGGIS